MRPFVGGAPLTWFLAAAGIAAADGIDFCRDAGSSTVCLACLGTGGRRAGSIGLLP